jgi:hypothetical protein
MLRSRTAAAVAALATLALPATSMAQSAGDNQYQDPLANSGGGSQGHITNSTGGGSGGSSNSGGGGGGSGSSSPSTSSNVPAASSATTGAGTSTPASGAAASGTPKGQLPRTGFDVIVSFELGIAMLLAGLVAHRMLTLRERRDS